MKSFLRVFLLVALIITGTFSTGFAQTPLIDEYVRPDDVKIEILSQLTGEEEQYNEKLLERSSILRIVDSPVAEISIYSTVDGSASSTNTSGHSWIYIYNWSRSPFTIGNKVVAPNTGITIGTWGNQGYDGVWYNLESGFPPHTNYSYTSEIGATDIVRISNYVTANDKWSMFCNCSHFATGVWNSTTMSKEFDGGTPSEVVPQIKSMSGYVTNKSYPVSGTIGHN